MGNHGCLLELFLRKKVPRGGGSRGDPLPRHAQPDGIQQVLCIGRKLFMGHNSLSQRINNEVDLSPLFKSQDPGSRRQGGHAERGGGWPEMKKKMESFDSFFTDIKLNIRDFGTFGDFLNLARKRRPLCRMRKLAG